MARVERSALVGFSAEQMFDLVNDIDRYPDFLPWCGGAEILNQSDTEIEATVHIAKAGIKQAFTTRNTLERPGLIKMDLVNGPFKSLAGTWKFTVLSEKACKVELDLEFEFSTSVLEKLIGVVFNQIANSMLDAFVKRANQQYG